MSKYNSKKVTYYGITFDSKSEGDYYLVLRERQKKGEISNLRCQVPYELLHKVEGTKEQVKHLKRGDKIVTVKYCKQRPTFYIADFVYEENGKEIVVDVKSAATRKKESYILKKKMMLALLGIELTEVIMAQKKKAGSGRPKPSAPRAGFKVNGSRYGCGGKLTKKKAS